MVRFVVRDEIEQRDRFMRENLDAMARKLGEMQARWCSSRRWASASRGLAGVKTDGSAPKTAAPSRRRPGAGRAAGPFVPMRTPSLEQLQPWSPSSTRADQDTDLLT